MAVTSPVRVPASRRQGKRDIVLVRGLPHFVRMLAPLLSSEGLWFEPSGLRRDFFTLRQFLRARAIYFISSSATTSTMANLALFFHKPVVMHWVGTDVLKALDAHTQGRISRRLSQSCIHWTEVPWTAKELASIGIQARVMPLTSAEFPATLPPMPPEFTILTYFDGRPQFYGFEHLRRLAEDFPDVPVHVVGDCDLRQQDVPINMKLLGRVENMHEQYAQCSVYVRMTQHDGLSFMVLESLGHGRHAIWTYPFEGVLLANDYQSLRDHVDRLLSLHRKKELRVNDAGAQFVRREYYPDKIADNLRRRMAEVIDGKERPNRPNP